MIEDLDAIEDLWEELDNDRHTRNNTSITGVVLKNRGKAVVLKDGLSLLPFYTSISELGNDIPQWYEEHVNMLLHTDASRKGRSMHQRMSDLGKQGEIVGGKGKSRTTKRGTKSKSFKHNWRRRK